MQFQFRICIFFNMFEPITISNDNFFFTQYYNLLIKLNTLLGNVPGIIIHVIYIMLILLHSFIIEILEQDKHIVPRGSEE